MKAKLLVVAVVFTAFLVCSGCVDSDEYNNGYEKGYSEHNDIAYSECASFLNASWCNHTFHEGSVDFASGYKRGYIDYFADNRTKYYEASVVDLMEG